MYSNKTKKKVSIPNLIQWVLYVINIVIGSIVGILFVSLIYKEVAKLETMTNLECLSAFLVILLLFFIITLWFESIAFIAIAIFQIRELITKGINIITLISLIVNISVLMISGIIAWLTFIY